MVSRMMGLILVLGMAACSSDSSDGIRMATIDEVRVMKVSGDQSAPVLGRESVTAQTSTIGFFIPAPSEVGEYTPEPLVGRVEAQVEGRGTGMTGPSGGVIVPPGTIVHWDIPAEAGRLLGTSTATDDSAYVINRWAPGTMAGTYTIKAQRITSIGEIVTDATWEVTVEPGAPVRMARVSYAVDAPGDSIDLLQPLQGSIQARDHYHNLIPDSVLAELWTPEWRIVENTYTSAGYNCGSETVDSGSGWILPSAPAYRDHGYCIEITIDGTFVGTAGLSFWFNVET